MSKVVTIPTEDKISRRDWDKERRAVNVAEVTQQNDGKAVMDGESPSLSVLSSVQSFSRGCRGFLCSRRLSWRGAPPPTPPLKRWWMWAAPCPLSATSASPWSPPTLSLPPLTSQSPTTMTKMTTIMITTTTWTPTWTAEDDVRRGCRSFGGGRQSSFKCVVYFHSRLLSDYLAATFVINKTDGAASFLLQVALNEGS